MEARSSVLIVQDVDTGTSSIASRSLVHTDLLASTIPLQGFGCSTKGEPLVEWGSFYGGAHVAFSFSAASLSKHFLANHHSLDADELAAEGGNETTASAIYFEGFPPSLAFFVVGSQFRKPIGSPSQNDISHPAFSRPFSVQLTWVTSYSMVGASIHA